MDGWEKHRGDGEEVYFDICSQGSGVHAAVKNFIILTLHEKNTSEVREGNRKVLKARKWKTSLFCLLRANWTVCEVDRTAETNESNP